MQSIRLLLALIFISFLFSSTKAISPANNYIKKYSTIAIQEMNRTGIPASITLAQGIIESASGTSGLARNSNNHFGIKCKGNWQGGTYYHKDDDYVNGKLVKSCFRTYKNPEESYYDHSEFLMVNKRYHFLFSLDKADYKAWAKGLKKAGYATAKNYATMLINTIEKYELYKYDREEFELLAVHEAELVPPKAERIPEYVNFKVHTTNTPSTTSSETLVAQAPPQPTLIPANYQPGDGLDKSNKKGSKRSNFYEDVYGKSSRYLDEISPQIAVRD